jgi:hypothetical protein
MACFSGCLFSFVALIAASGSAHGAGDEQLLPKVRLWDLRTKRAIVLEGHTR